MLKKRLGVLFIQLVISEFLTRSYYDNQKFTDKLFPLDLE